MAENENIGQVSVLITGDPGPLGAALSAAQAQAATAGTEVASAFTQGAASVDDMATATVRAAAAEAGFASATETATAALGHQVSQIQATSGALRVLEGSQGIRAAERFLTLIPGLGPALQAAFPIIGLVALGEMVDRVAEKFIGLKESIEAAGKSAQEAEAAVDKTLDNADRVNVQLQTMQFGGAAGKKLEGFYTQAAADRDIAKVRGLNAEVESMERRASSFHFTDIIPKYGSEIRQKEQADIQDKQNQQLQLQAEAEAKLDNAKLQRAQQIKDAQEEAGQLSVKRIEGDEQANVRAAQISKQVADAQVSAAHAVQQQRIAGIDSEYAKVVETGQEEVRFERAKEDQIAGYALATRDRTIQEIRAKASAESAGKSAPEQSLIQAGAQSDVQKAKDDYTLATAKAAIDVQNAQQTAGLKLVDLNQQVTKSLELQVREGWDKVAAAARTTAEESQRAISEDLTAKTRVAEIQSKSEGDVAALQVQQQKIALERTYALEVGHTGAEQVAQARALEVLNAQERADKLAGIQAELQAAQAADTTVRDETKIATLEAQIAALKQQNRNADAQAAASIDVMNQKLNTTLTLQQQITSMQGAASNTLQQNNQQAGAALGNAIGGLPKSVGDDIGGSISEALLGHHPGKSIGQEMSKALTDSLKSTLGSIFKQALSSVFQIGLSFLGFAEGTDSAPGGMAMVGEKGPEIVNLPRGSQVIPNHAIRRYAEGTPGWMNTYHSQAFSTGTTSLHFHAHGVQDPDRFIGHVMRKLPDVLKSRYSGFSPLST